MTHLKPAPSTRVALFTADATILYLAFVAGLKIRLGAWQFNLLSSEWGTAMLLAFGVYLVALLLSGLYRQQPHRMHLDAFLRVATTLLVAWAASLTLIYLATPDRITPRSITVAHCVFSITGILGLRALLRFLYEHERPTREAPTLPIALPEVDIQALLQRPPLEITRTALGDYLAGRTVLVTGAGGSIGAALSHQLIDLRPFRLVLVDVSEYNLYQLENTMRKLPFEGELAFRIADVRDETIMRSLFSTYQPDLVFHAAAYKHVPLMERHPIEAFRNNTMTTVALTRLCESFQTEQFILVSTDKAVEPASVLGATKRLAEWYVRAVNAPMQCKTVRFGNVLASQGSVVPLFVGQIAAGGPVTVTHPEMTRYFMSVVEACGLILQTLLLNSAPVYTLKMGEPIRIQWLAEELIRTLRPEANLEVNYVGIRPGEKLSERLWSDQETPNETAHESIVGLQSHAPYSRAELDAYFSYLMQLCLQNRTAELRKALFQSKLTTLSPS